MTPAYFKQAYFSLHPKLYRVAFAILKNTEDAEDILQDAYCKLWDGRAKLAGIQKPEAYCLTLVKHLCLDYLRSPRKAALRNDSVDEHDVPDCAANAETDMANRETIEKIQSLLLRLPEKQRRILDLHAFAGCSAEETERLTGESPENVRVLLSRARNTLRTKLKHDNYD